MRGDHGIPGCRPQSAGRWARTALANGAIHDDDGSLVKKDDGIGVTTYAGSGTEVYQIPAGRDLVGDDFNDGNADGWSATGGAWAVEKRAYSGLGNAMSLWTPTFRTGKVWAKGQTQSLGAIARNGYLVFDYRDADNYRFAGLLDDSNQWVIGERLAGTLYTRAAAPETINTGQWYSLELVVSGRTASLKAGGVKKVGYTFGDGVQGGKVGLLVVNAHSHFDDVVVSCQVIDDFRDGDADGWASSGGTWQVENPFYGEYSGQDAGTQLSLWSQSMTSGRLGATVIAQTNSAPQYNGYLVFDYLDASNYKYAGMDGTNGQWVIREVISGTDTLRASVAGTIVKGTLYDVEVQVSGSLATLKVGGAVKTSYTFGGIQGGKVGLRIAQAHTHFKEVYLRAFAQVSKYYTFGGQRIAMRRDHVLYFLAADHLGTVSVVLDAAGNKVDESRHYPYGTERWPVDGTFPTGYRFTGQLLDSSLGLYQMGARLYDAALARWLSADTIVPSPANPQSLNRYTWVLANPLRGRDPSGHTTECGIGEPDATCSSEDEEADARDLTYWLVTEGNADASSLEVWIILLENTFGGGAKLVAYIMWADLVKDGARWDFKDAIRLMAQGEAIKLGQEWFEYSTPGNMLYGLTGAAAGFSSIELHAGASFAQILDDLGSRDAKDDVGPVWPSFLDQEPDFYAIDFGYRLYGKYGADVKVAEFEAFLVSYEPSDGLPRVPTPTDYQPAPPDWPYAPGRFDGPN